MLTKKKCARNRSALKKRQCGEEEEVFRRRDSVSGKRKCVEEEAV